MSRLCLAMLLFVAVLGDAAAQSTQRVAALYFSVESAPWHRAFELALAELGHAPGKGVSIERYAAKGDSTQLRVLAERAAASKPDVIFVSGTAATLAAANATGMIPIVFTSVSDPVASGLTKSLARPSRNLTGLSNFSGDLSGKRLELLKEVLQKTKRVAAFHSGDEASRVQLKGLERAASRLGIEVSEISAKTSKEFSASFGEMKRRQVDAVAVLGTSLFASNRAPIAKLSLQYRLPTVCANRDYVADGCLASYGPDFAELSRRAAAYVDKILKGAKPADLPIEQPSKFELVVNLKTAQAIGLHVPKSVLLRADEVIQ